MQPAFGTAHLTDYGRTGKGAEGEQSCLKAGQVLFSAEQLGPFCVGAGGGIRLRPTELNWEGSW